MHYDSVLVSTYGYDANSNRTIYEGDFGTVATTDYDARDRLKQYGGTTYAYTEAGELTSKAANGQTVTFDYDVFGNLRQVALPSGPIIDYVIDAAQRRVGKKIDGVLVKGWLYQDSLNPIAELDATGEVVARYVYGTRPNAPDYMVKAGFTYRIITDHLGSPRLVVDASTGAIAQEMRYDEFGRITLDTNPGFQPFGFAGGLYDYQTGLVRFGARDYDPEVGRWTATDPIGFNGETSNLYQYAFGNPVVFVDMQGRIGDAGAFAAMGFGAYRMAKENPYDTPAVREAFVEMFEDAQFGRSNHEEFAWVYRDDEAGLACKRLTSTRETRQTSASRQASRWANRIIPIYSLHRKGIFEYDPFLNEITQIAPRNWFKNK